MHRTSSCPKIQLTSPGTPVTVVTRHATDLCIKQCQSPVLPNRNFQVYVLHNCAWCLWCSHASAVTYDVMPPSNPHGTAGHTPATHPVTWSWCQRLQAIAVSTLEGRVTSKKTSNTSLPSVLVGGGKHCPVLLCVVDCSAQCCCLWSIALQSAIVGGGQDCHEPLHAVDSIAQCSSLRWRHCPVPLLVVDNIAQCYCLWWTALLGGVACGGRWSSATIGVGQH